MALFTELVLVAVVAWLIYHFVQDRKDSKNLPPGPRGLPVIGSLLSLSFPAYTIFGNWARKYGNIMRFKVVNYE